jgi:hypothetical protein
MRKLYLFFVLFFIASVSNVFAYTITFDDLPTYYNSSVFGDPGDYGTSLIYGDVTFETVANAHLLTTGADFDPGFGMANSAPNKLTFSCAPEFRTVSEITILFDKPVEDFSFWLNGTGYDTTINAYDKKDNLIETFVQPYPQVPPPPGWNDRYDIPHLVSLNSSDISWVTIQPSRYDAFSIDDVSYERAHGNGNAPVPEPATLSLLGLGLSGLGLLRRKKK